MFRALCLLLLIFVVEGCYTTVVQVESTPPGSTVHWDYEPKGTTPSEFEEDWYGAHRLTLDHPDYGQHVEKVELKAPAYLWFPLDFFVAIMPFHVTDRQEIFVDLEKDQISVSEEDTHEPQEPETQEQ